MKQGNTITIIHSDFITHVRGKVISLNPLKVEYKYQGMWYTAENPQVVTK